MNYFKRRTQEGKDYMSVRMGVFMVLVIACFILIIGKVCYLTLVPSTKAFWAQAANRLVKKDVPIKPRRGNILSDDGKLLVTTLPTYRVSIDYLSGVTEKKTARKSPKNQQRRARELEKRKKLVRENITPLANGLHELLPDYSASYYRNRLLKGFNRQSRSWSIYPGRVDYSTLQEIQKLPLFNLGRYKGGFTFSESLDRKRLFGSLAAITLGVYDSKNSKRALAGIEKSFNEELKGKPGKKDRKKFMTHYLDVIKEPAIDGYDITTTLNIDMQDICDAQVRKEAIDKHADVGVAVLMETKTGQIKAIVNLIKGNDGHYYELSNRAIGDMMEPGSTFKTASLLVALDDGKITLEDSIDVGNGVKEHHGRYIKDWNWRTGGYKRYLSVPEILGFSSNIGTAELIVKHYEKNPQKYIDGLKRIGILDSLGLQIKGGHRPSVISPDSKGWNKTSLAWLSFGYNSQIAPINTLTFYNTIANNGREVKPYFIKKIEGDDGYEKIFEPEVIRSSICSKHALRDIQYMLRYVVEEGTGKLAGNDHFAVAGKTGTAQIYDGKYGYNSGKALGSFCGYFPADNPKYSLIVSFSGKHISSHSGAEVFGRIAERVYAHTEKCNIRLAMPEKKTIFPSIKYGHADEIKKVLNTLDIPYELDKNTCPWVKVKKDSVNKELDLFDAPTIHKNIMPNVYGYGLKDAIYLLEKLGLHVSISGYGRVWQQSVRAGTRIHKGNFVTLKLRNY